LGALSCVGERSHGGGAGLDPVAVTASGGHAAAGAWGHRARTDHVYPAGKHLGRRSARDSGRDSSEAIRPYAGNRVDHVWGRPSAAAPLLSGGPWEKGAVASHGCRFNYFLMIFPSGVRIGDGGCRVQRELETLSSMAVLADPQ
jgi:hypothetical protein